MMALAKVLMHRVDLDFVSLVHYLYEEYISSYHSEASQTLALAAVRFLLVLLDPAVR